MSEPTRMHTVAAADGEFDVSLWLPPTGHGPGIVLLQEIFGVSAYIKDVAERLAAAGYVVAAPDLFWRQERNFAPDHDEAGMGQAFAMVQQFDAADGVADSLATLDHLRSLAEVTGGVGVMGFCLGGTLAHLVGAAGQPDLVVSYYGSGVPDALDQLDAIRGPAMYHFGGNDAFIPRDAIDRVGDAIAATGRPELKFVLQPDAGHAFDNHAAPMFHDPAAAASAWATTMDFLTEHLPT